MPEIICDNVYPENSGKGCRKAIGTHDILFLSLVRQEFATTTAAKVEAAWTTLINKDAPNTLYPFKIDMYVPANDEPVFQTLNEDKQHQVRTKAGVDQYKILDILPEEQQRIRESWQNKICYAMVGTSQNYGYAYTPDGTKIQMYKVKVNAVTFEKQTDPTSYAVVFHIQILEIEDALNKPIAWKSTAFNLSDLEGKHNVTITPQSLPAGTSTTKRVYVTDAFNGAAITGLVAEDWTLQDSDAVPLAVSSCTAVASAPGYYDLVFAEKQSDTVTLNLKTSENMTTKGYDSAGAVTFVTP